MIEPTGKDEPPLSINLLQKKYAKFKIDACYRFSRLWRPSGSNGTCG